MARSQFEAFRVDTNGPEPETRKRSKKKNQRKGSQPKSPPISEPAKKKALVQVATERVTLYLRPEAASQYKQLKAKLGCSGPDLAAEAINLLFAKHGMKPFA